MSKLFPNRSWAKNMSTTRKKSMQDDEDHESGEMALDPHVWHDALRMASHGSGNS